jgi:hypothetical protein
MADQIINFTAQRLTGATGTYNATTGRANATLVDTVALGVSGNASPRDLDAIRKSVASMTGSPTAMLDRVAESAGTASSGSAGAAGGSGSGSATTPNGYARGIYSAAKTDGDIRLGFKGDLVTSRQQMLKDQGYDLGSTGTKRDGVDGFWGANTEKAWNQYLTDTRGQGSTGRAQYTKEEPTTVASDLSKAMRKDTPETNFITKDLTTLPNSQMTAVDRAMSSQTGQGLAKTVAQMDDNKLTGNAGDYKDLLTRMAAGNRNEGENAGARNKVVDQYAKQLAGASTTTSTGLWQFLGGTDRQTINDVFSSASGAQLSELDRRFRQGVKASDGRVVQFSDGLKGYVNANTYEGDHRNALLAQLNRPLR